MTTMPIRDVRLFVEVGSGGRCHEAAATGGAEADGVLATSPAARRP